MKSRILLVILVISSLCIGCSKNITTIEGVEEFFIKNDYQFTSKPVEEYQVDYALEQRLYEIEGIGELYIYRFSSALERNKADLELSNELLGPGYAVAPTDKFLFVYRSNSPDHRIHVVINEIKKVE